MGFSSSILKERHRTDPLHRVILDLCTPDVGRKRVLSCRSAIQVVGLPGSRKAEEVLSPRLLGSCLIFSICYTVTVCLCLPEAPQLGIALINSLYYFAQINTPALIRG